MLNKHRLPILAIAAAISIAGCKNDYAESPAAQETAAPSVRKETRDLLIVHWGQQRSVAGKPFNEQGDGNSGIFFEFNGRVEGEEVSVLMDGKPLKGIVTSGNVVTAVVPLEYLSTPGSFPIEILFPKQNLRLQVGQFTIQAP
ncbi:MAG: hypothetical protein LC715_03200 [Gammaproteobacteria bacterium]|nr:hypothetical protein [Gammaproteobacteria bacterium]